MTIIKKKTLVAYYAVYPLIQKPLEAWYFVMKGCSCENIKDLRKTFQTADLVEKNTLVCFNIKGNKYRLITRITWGKTVFIRELLTHKEYTIKYMEVR